MTVAKFIWGSSQYDTLAGLYRLASLHSLKESIERLKGEGFDIEYELHTEMIEVLKDGKLGEIFNAWRNESHDLWYALAMAEDLVFKHGMEISHDDENLPTDHPIRQSLVALACVEFGLIKDEEPFEGWDT